MKKYLLISLFTLLCANISFAQEVFPTSDAIWNIHNSLYDYNRKGECYYGLKGDTTINENIYQKMYFWNDTTLNIDTRSTYIGRIRELDKKVYFTSIVRGDFNKREQEIILYDFSKNPGDTIYHGNFYVNNDLGYWEGLSELPNNWYWISIIEEIIEIEDKNQFLVKTGIYDSEHNLLNEIQEIKWIEGVGGDYGPIWEPIRIAAGDDYNNFYPKLVCLKERNQIVYLNNEKCGSCFCDNSLSINRNKTNLLCLQINRSNKEIIISENTEERSYFFELIDTKGQIVMIKKLTHKIEKISFSINKGTFLYKIIGDNNFFQTGKIIL